jgi:hypothetical protein
LAIATLLLLAACGGASNAEKASPASPSPTVAASSEPPSASGEVACQDFEKLDAYLQRHGIDVSPAGDFNDPTMKGFVGAMVEDVKQTQDKLLRVLVLDMQVSIEVNSQADFDQSYLNLRDHCRN